MKKTGLIFSDLEYLPRIKFDVANVDDYNIVGTFDPNASCDTEYFGFRETTFDVTAVYFKKADGTWRLADPYERLEFSGFCDSRITSIVQNKIDGF
ncbi:hypothetical protein vBPpSSYP_119 [Pseudomonas phage vB_PpS_SYP]|nr:hypothetical protein vBPpSSYP_119 [Pseudomonas phage vB_PpS_SYP]